MSVVHEMMPLNMLSEGRAARVSELLGDADQIQRLEELGLQRGVRIEMVCAGSPCIIRLDGARLCFRCSDLLGVLVSPEEAA